MSRLDTELAAARLAVNDWHACASDDELERWRRAQLRLIDAAKAVGQHGAADLNAELLAALKAIVEHEQIDGIGIRYTFDWNSPLGKQARAAIKKAEA